MNAAIRAVVRTGIAKGWEVFGVRNGYAGLCDGQMEVLGARDVGNILQRGGTFLGSARLPEFKDEAVRARGLAQLNAAGIDGLVVIGGNGTQTGALALSKSGLPVVGVASTIDNDLAGSEMTIGVDTALNIALEAIDRLRVTASSHKRAFLVEVMGRNCGYLALMAGIAGGADSVVIPEVGRGARADRAEPAGRLGARQAARDGGGGRGRQAQRRQAGAALRAREGPAGIRPARHHARSRAARRRAGRLRSPAGDAAGGGGDRSVWIAASTAAWWGSFAARCAPRRSPKWSAPARPIDLKLLQLQKVLAQ